MLDLDKVSEKGGVYLLRDLDGHPAYAGQSKNLWKRLRDHLVDQRSGVVSEVLLDVYEVREVVIWYQFEPSALPFEADNNDDSIIKTLDVMEAALIKDFEPRWNRAKGNRREINPPKVKLTLDNCDLRLAIEEAELEERCKPLHRIEAKLLHLLRAVRRVRVSGKAPTAKRALKEHASDLVEICEHGLERRRSLSRSRTEGPHLEFDIEANDAHTHRPADGTNADADSPRQSQ